MSTGAGLGMGLSLSGPEQEPTTAVNEAIDPDAPRSRRYRPAPPEEVAFPVAPMLDMAFQLLAFFILTFKSPSAETHVDLDLPATPAALPAAARGPGPAPAEPAGRHRPGERPPGPRRGRRPGRPQSRCGWARPPCPTCPPWAAGSVGTPSSSRAAPLRVRLVADDRLRYEPAAQIIATCSAAGVASIRLSPPGATPAVPAPRSRGTSGPSGAARPPRGPGGIAMNGRRLSGILPAGAVPRRSRRPRVGQDADPDRDHTGRSAGPGRPGRLPRGALGQGDRRRGPAVRSRRPRSVSATCGSVPTPIAAVA